LAAHESDVRRDYEGGTGGSLLDRRVDLTAVPADLLAWSALVLLAGVIRLLGRTSWPLSAQEASVATDALALIRGEDISNAAFSHPFLVQATGLMLFLFGDTDYTVRLVPLLAGLGTLVVLFLARHTIGNLAALSMALLIAVSPTLSFASLRLDGGGALVFFLLVIAVLSLGYEERRSRTIAIALGGAAGLALAADPLAWLAVPLALVVGAAMADLRRPARPDVVATLAGLAGSLAIVATFFGTRPAGLWRFPQESIGALWDTHLSTIGDAWFLTIMVLVVEEPFALVFALLAALSLVAGRLSRGADRTSHVARGGLLWLGFSVALGLLLGGKGPALYAVVTLPLALMGGIGLERTLAAVRRSRPTWLEVSLFLLALAGAVIALVRLVDFLLRGPDEDTFGWLLSGFVLIVLITLPLALLLFRLLVRLERAALPMTLVAVAIVLGLMGLRSTLLLPVTTTERPGELLLAGSTAPSVPRVGQRVARYSRDVTTYVRDARDPAGGHGLVIAVEADLRDPFVWYFRNFPDLVVIEPGAPFTDMFAPDVIIAHPDNTENYLAGMGTYGHLAYVATYELPEHLADARWGRMLVSAANPFEYRDFVNFIVYRNTRAPIQAEYFSLMMREDHAQDFWGWLPQ
jgi:hypothetical protein